MASASTLLNILLEFGDFSELSPREVKVFLHLKKALIQLLSKGVRGYSSSSQSSTDSIRPPRRRLKRKVGRKKKKKVRMSTNSNESSKECSNSQVSRWLRSRRTCSLPPNLNYTPETPSVSSCSPHSSSQCLLPDDELQSFNPSAPIYVGMNKIKECHVALHSIDVKDIPSGIKLAKSDVSLLRGDTPIPQSKTIVKSHTERRLTDCQPQRSGTSHIKRSIRASRPKRSDSYGTKRSVQAGTSASAASLNEERVSVPRWTRAASSIEDVVTSVSQQTSSAISFNGRDDTSLYKSRALGASLNEEKVSAPRQNRPASAIEDVDTSVSQRPLAAMSFFGGDVTSLYQSRTPGASLNEEIVSVPRQNRAAFALEDVVTSASTCTSLYQSKTSGVSLNEERVSVPRRNRAASAIKGVVTSVSQRPPSAISFNGDATSLYKSRTSGASHNEERGSVRRQNRTASAIEDATSVSQRTSSVSFFIEGDDSSFYQSRMSGASHIEERVPVPRWNKTASAIEGVVTSDSQRTSSATSFIEGDISSLYQPSTSGSSLIKNPVILDNQPSTSGAIQVNRRSISTHLYLRSEALKSGLIKPCYVKLKRLDLPTPGPSTSQNKGKSRRTRKVSHRKRGRPCKRKPFKKSGRQRFERQHSRSTTTEPWGEDDDDDEPFLGFSSTEHPSSKPPTSSLGKASGSRRKTIDCSASKKKNILESIKEVNQLIEENKRLVSQIKGCHENSEPIDIEDLCLSEEEELLEFEKQLWQEAHMNKCLEVIEMIPLELRRACLDYRPITLENFKKVVKI